jgi:hypothetical protein
MVEFTVQLIYLWTPVHVVALCPFVVGLKVAHYAPNAGQLRTEAEPTVLLAHLLGK